MENAEKIIEALLLEIAELKREIEKLRKENAELKARLEMNSSNSSLPPSSDKFKKKIKKGL